VLPAGRYRYNQPYLFQHVTERTIRARTPGSGDLVHDIYGPTSKYADYQSAWLWDRSGGDWIDANLVRYGTTPWFSAPVVGEGATLVRSYTVDVTAMVSHCFKAQRWCAVLLTYKNAPRTIAGLFHPQHAGPTLNVIYRDGRAATLKCRVVAANTPSSSQPLTAVAEIGLPAFVEFDRPALDVSSASLTLVVTQHWSGFNPTIDGYLLDPPLNTEPLRPGVAASAGLTDEGITTKAGVIGAHRYMDGTAWEDFVLPGALNHADERNFDPAIFGTGARNLSKLPHQGLGKWVNTSSDWSLINSSYRGEGFAPLTPGMGAMRIQMAPGTDVVTGGPIVDGSIVGSSGSLAGNAMLFLPEPIFGLLGRIFVRYYFRLGGTGRVTKADRKNVQHSRGSYNWTTMGGKFGIGPDHTTSWGGVSGSSGGPYGWQMRNSWMECDAEVGGPQEGGWAVGHHLYDFQSNNPPGHNYSDPQGERWGQRGGLGGMLYAGKWYCLETELKLNTISNNAPGFLPNGELRTWIDGRLAFERTGMVFRSGPVAALAPADWSVRPARELGVKGLWLNWFHGGRTLSTVDRTTFYTGLVYGNDYIGPMRLPG
jgi:hypothetical protein